MDLNSMGQNRLDAKECGEISAEIAVEEQIEAPGRELAEYRHRLNAELLSTSLPRTLARARSSHDLEDLMVVVELVEEIHSGEEVVRAYIAAEIRKLLAVREFSTHYLAICCPTKRTRLASRSCWSD